MTILPDTISHSPISLEEITNPEALVALRPEWRRLWERCPAATPFQSPEWLLTWWKHFGAGELWIIALRRQGDLVGLAPLFISGANQPGSPRRQLSMIGTGITDYLDFLLEPDIAMWGAARILEHLMQSPARWDVCVLDDIPTGSPLLTISVPADWPLKRWPQHVCPVLSLPRTAADLFDQLPSNRRRNLRRARSRLEAPGPLDFQVADEKALPEWMEMLFRLHRARWQQCHLPGVLGPQAIHRFHQEAAAGLLQRGCLRLYGLRSNGVPIAALYLLVWNGRAYAYLSGFDPELKTASPGTVLVAHAIEESIREGLHEFDFLRGKEAHKYAWGAKDRPNYRLWMRHAAYGKDEG